MLKVDERYLNRYKIHCSVCVCNIVSYWHQRFDFWDMTWYFDILCLMWIISVCPWYSIIFGNMTEMFMEIKDNELHTLPSHTHGTSPHCDALWWSLFKMLILYSKLHPLMLHIKREFETAKFCKILKFMLAAENLWNKINKLNWMVCANDHRFVLP